MKDKLGCILYILHYFILFIPSLLMACAAYFYALAYFWSCFVNSPLGHEECGLEGIVWVIFIPPMLIISFILKLILFFKLAYPKIFLISPIFLAALLFMFTLDKGRGQGIMAISFILWEFGVDIYSAFVAKNNLQKKV